MEKFVVSARKYRPQNFNSVIGQSHITTTLKNAISQNQLAHAFLFCGPRGVGKTTCARILAKTINCEQRTADNEACDTCNSCVSFNNGTSLNIHELDAASNNSVDDIRDLVDQVRYAPQVGSYKVYIVDEVHMLSQSAFNAFLKTLEEPPPYAIFILATTEKHKILPTILSRCQIFDFKRITPEDTVAHLREITKKEHIEAQDAALHVIALKSEGCLRDSLSMLDKIVSFTNGKLEYSNTLEHLNILDEDYYFRLIQMLINEDLPGTLLLFEEVNQKGFEGDTFLEGFSEFIRNLLVSKDEKSVALLEVAKDFKEKYLSTAKEVSMSWLLSSLNIISESLIQYKQARNKKLQVELTLIKLAYLQQTLDLVGGSEKKKLTDNRVLSFRAIASPIPKKEQKPAKPVMYVEEPVAQPMQKHQPAKQAVSSPEPVVAATPSKKPTLNIKKLQAIAVEATRPNDPIPLTPELLMEKWNEFLGLLRKTENAAVPHITTAILEVLTASTFQITLDAPFRLSFIENVRKSLLDHMQESFNNPKLSFNTKLVQSEDAGEPEERPLTPGEQYRKMVELYPLVDVLRKALKLDTTF